MNVKSIAVISPFKNETAECVQRSIDTVAQQTHPVAMHIIVCDGGTFPSHDVTLPEHVNIITLPAGCEDTGATPRSIGSIFALSQFRQAIAYLDIDNQWSACGCVA